MDIGFWASALRVTSIILGVLIAFSIAGAYYFERQLQRQKDEKIAALQQKLAPRTVTGEQAHIISTALAPFRGEKLTLFQIVGTEEVDRFTTQLKATFEAAGIEVDLAPGQIFGSAKSGLSASMGRDREPFLRAIAKALLSARLITGSLNTDRSNDPNELTIFIWPK